MRRYGIWPVPGNEKLNRESKKAVDQTYKNYPQQPGQPTIIINNIIVPSDYQHTPARTFSSTLSQPGYTEPTGRDFSRNTLHRELSEEEWRDYQAYRDWRRHSKEDFPPRYATDAYQRGEKQASLN